MKALFIATGIVSHSNVSNVSGGDVRFVEIAKKWAEKGIEIHILTSKPGVELCKNFGLNAVYHVIESKNMGNVFTYLSRIFTSSISLPKSLDSFSEGIVYSSSEQLSDVLPAYKLKKKFGDRIKWLVAVHWVPPFPPWKRQRAGFTSSISFYILERLGLNLAIKHADVLMPVSDSTFNQLKEINIPMQKVHVVECGVNFEAINKIVSKVKEKKYDGVFMKRFHPAKGIYDIIEVWSEVVKKYPKSKLALIGSGPDDIMHKLKELIKKYNLERNVDILGVIFDPEKKFRILAQSKLFVLPTYEENWAIVIGEAMASRIPVIAYESKELNNVWADNYVHAKYGDKKDFAGKVINYLANPKLSSAISAKAFNFVKKYDWKKIAGKELKLAVNKNKKLY